MKWDTTPPTSVEGLNDTKGYSAFYIKNGSGTPAAERITDITLKDHTKPDDQETNVVSQFTDNNKGSLTFNYDLSSGVYSPAYVFITIWLDVDGDGVHDSDETLTEDVTIVIYPAIYIIGEESPLFSVFVNGWWNNQGAGNVGNFNDNNNYPYRKINGQQVGKVTGWDTSKHMHVVTISAFSADKEEDYMFAYNNEKKYDTEYIIGDPRVRKSNTYGVTWANDPSGKTLTNYYPTSTDPNAYQVIAPKFRISSKLAGYSHSSPQGAAYRCASYQEAGYPAGRWRLPTTAEVLFVIRLQEKGAIESLFHGGRSYASATDNIKNNDNTFTLTKGHDGYDNNNTLSVRCVYDEWYWGSEKEAKSNNSYNGGYEFTWGDEKVY